MKFSAQRHFTYDRALFQSTSLDSITRGSTPDSFALSGLEDLRGVIEISREYFQQFPKITIKELDRKTDGGSQEVDSVYREAKINARYQFSRIFKISSWVTFADPEIKHAKTGQTLTQPITAALCLLDLHDQDYFPGAGDQVVFNGRLYDVAFTQIKASDYFQNTMVPLYFHIVCGLHQYGDRRPPAILDAATVVHGAQPLGAAESSQEFGAGPETL